MHARAHTHLFVSCSDADFAKRCGTCRVSEWTRARLNNFVSHGSYVLVRTLLALLLRAAACHEMPFCVCVTAVYVPVPVCASQARAGAGKNTALEIFRNIRTLCTHTHTHNQNAPNARIRSANYRTTTTTRGASKRALHARPCERGLGAQPSAVRSPAARRYASLQPRHTRHAGFRSTTAR